MNPNDYVWWQVWLQRVHQLESIWYLNGPSFDIEFLPEWHRLDDLIWFCVISVRHSLYSIRTEVFLIYHGTLNKCYDVKPGETNGPMFVRSLTFIKYRHWSWVAGLINHYLDDCCWSVSQKGHFVCPKSQPVQVGLYSFETTESPPSNAPIDPIHDGTSARWARRRQVAEQARSMFTRGIALSV